MAHALLRAASRLVSTPGSVSVAAAATLIAVLALSACSHRTVIVVGSKNFTEQRILGEIAAQQIERKLHIPVERRLGLGGTLLAHEALLHGGIDLYPEYTGTAASAILKQKVSRDPMTAYREVRDAARKRFHVVWLPPLGFNDTFAMVVRSADARRLAAPTLSAAASRSWRLGVGYEFLTRPDGLRRLDAVYHLKWKGSPKTMDLGLLYPALREHKIDMGAGNSTDGFLADPTFMALKDDKHAFPPYSACYVVRAQTIREHPKVKQVLAMLSGRMNAAAMRGLNRRVDIAHQPVAQVARQFLAAQP
ncbi:MAG: glycine betaine ABC transporter substrate-binding protein [Bryobacteraceae bacterium]